MEKSNWVTEITHFQIPQNMDINLRSDFFIDEQKFCTYTLWHHKHHFLDQENGEIISQDIENYKLHFGILGKLLAGTFLKIKVKIFFLKIFSIFEKLLG